MGYNIKKANKAIQPKKPYFGAAPAKKSYEDAEKVSFGTRGRNELVDQAHREKVIPSEQEIPGYDYKQSQSDKDKLREQANEIAKDITLSDAEKREKLGGMIETQRKHNETFAPDKKHKQHLRDNMLNKSKTNEDRFMDNFERYTDGEWRTKK